jgi:hypothetical protein
MSKWLLSAAACGAFASALLWQPPFNRELIVCGLVALIVAAGRYLRDLFERR